MFIMMEKRYLLPAMNYIIIIYTIIYTILVSYLCICWIYFLCPWVQYLKKKYKSLFRRLPSYTFAFCDFKNENVPNTLIVIMAFSLISVRANDSHMRWWRLLLPGGACKYGPKHHTLDNLRVIFRNPSSSR